jgi:hypothetical protein
MVLKGLRQICDRFAKKHCLGPALIQRDDLSEYMIRHTARSQKAIEVVRNETLVSG